MTSEEAPSPLRLEAIFSHEHIGTDDDKSLKIWVTKMRNALESYVNEPKDHGFGHTASWEEITVAQFLELVAYQTLVRWPNIGPEGIAFLAEVLIKAGFETSNLTPPRRGW